MNERVLQVAIAGNPNSGKTTLFNLLTGSRERVGNWSGVTVEGAAGTYQYDGQAVRVTDLPGIYSFATHTLDERAAAEGVLRGRPDLVVNLLDAANLERSLYLTAQLLEIRVPLVVVLNRVDIAERRGLRIDAAHLSRHLGCPVVSMVACRGDGTAALRDAIAEIGRSRQLPSASIAYDGALEAALADVAAAAAEAAARHEVDRRWLALKLIEQDPLALQMTDGKLDSLVKAASDRVARHRGEAVEATVMAGRLGFIRGLAAEVISRRHLDRQLLSDAVDRILLSRLAGPLVFLGVMYLVFAFTVRATHPLVDFLDRFMGALLVDGTTVLLDRLQAPPALTALLANGVGAGLVAVATFLPPIAAIFICLGLLEESGYMSRAAFVMDRLMNRIGLPGKAFIPLLVGFGCTVPALMSTRTLEARRERVLTMLITPFMSCGARLPVYTLFAIAFFPERSNQVVFALYLVGALMAVLSGLLLHRTILAGEATDFVMELPPYHVPHWRGCLRHVAFNLRSFIVRAGKVIVLITLGLSLVNVLGDAFLPGAGGPASPRLVERVGRGLTPVLEPLGVRRENWPASVGLLSGLLAKESIVATLEVMYATHAAPADDQPPPPRLVDELRDACRQLAGAYRRKTGAPTSEAPGGMLAAMRAHFGSRPAAFAYLLFVLIYSPCVAALIVLGREAGWRWMAFSVAYQSVLAWLTATVFYQAATFRDAPAAALGWIVMAAATVAAIAWGLAAWGRRHPWGAQP